MAEEINQESVLDTVTAAVNEQREKAQVEPGPQIAAGEQAKAAEEPSDTEPSAAEVVEEEPKGDRERDSSGRFKAKAQQEESVPEPREAAAEEPKEVPQADTRPDISRPPRRVPLKTKQNWLSLPEWAREDIYAREADNDRSYKRYNGLEQFADKAELAGTTLPKAMASYHALEVNLRQDPIRGAAMALQAAGHNPEVIFRAIANLFSGQQDGQAPPMQMPQAPPQQDIPTLVREQLKAEQVSSAIAAFEADPHNIYYDNVKPTMLALASAPGFKESADLAKDLKELYNKACRAEGLDPGVKQSSNGQDQKAAAVARSRQAAKATIGAPPPKAVGQSPDDGDTDMQSVVRAAYNKARGE